MSSNCCSLKSSLRKFENIHGHFLTACICRTKRCFKNDSFCASISFSFLNVFCLPQRKSIVDCVIIHCIPHSSYVFKNTRINHSLPLRYWSLKAAWRQTLAEYWQQQRHPNISNIDIYKWLYVNSFDWAWTHMKFNAPYA